MPSKKQALQKIGRGLRAKKAREQGKTALAIELEEAGAQIPRTGKTRFEREPTLLSRMSKKHQAEVRKELGGTGIIQTGKDKITQQLRLDLVTDDIVKTVLSKEAKRKKRK